MAKNKHLELIFKVIETRANDWRSGDRVRRQEAERFFCSKDYQYMVSLLGLGAFSLPKGVEIDRDKMAIPANPIIPQREKLLGDFGKVEVKAGESKPGFKTRLLDLIKNVKIGVI